MPLGQERPQRLVNRPRQPERVGGLAVPRVRKPHHVVRANDAAARGCAASAHELVVHVQGSVVVRELLTGVDVANGDFEVEARAATVGRARVVDEAAVVPAEDAAARFDVGVPLSRSSATSGGSLIATAGSTI